MYNTDLILWVWDTFMTIHVIRACSMGLLLVSNWSYFKRVSLIGKFHSTKWTRWIKLFSINSSFEQFKWNLLRISETSMSFSGKCWSSGSHFWRRRKNFSIRGVQEIIDLLKIDFSGLWSSITINLRPYKYS